MDDQILVPLQEKMLKATEIVRQDMATVRTGRANPQLVENVFVSVYGGSQKLRLKELATITTSDARSLLVSPYDVSIVEEISKGLQEANLGFNPQSEGKLIRIVIPPLTEERRGEYQKLVRTKAEGGRIMIRQIRHEGMNSLKKQLENGEVDEDTKKRLEKRIQQLTDEMIAEIDSILNHKEEELMRI